MIPANPAGAVLWECWRLSRGPLVIRVLASTLIGGVLLLGFGGSPVAAVFALLVTIMVALSAQNWAWSVDDRTGFTLVLGFTRPIRTWVLVVVPMVYIAMMSALTYLLPAIALRFAFDVRFPLFPVAAAIAVISLSIRASQWWTAHTPTRIAGRLGIAAVLGLWFVYEQSDDGFMAPERWSEISTISAGDYARLAMVGVIAIGLTVVGVGRQRRGDDVLGLSTTRAADREDARRLPGVSGFASRLRVSCPTSSPLRAQLWYEAHALGIPVVLSGLGGAAAIAFLVALIAAAESNEFAQASLAGLAIWAALAPLIIAARKVLGLRRKQGHVHLSSFDGARPMGSPQLVWIRVSVVTVSLLVAWVAVAVAGWSAREMASLDGELFSEIGRTVAGLSARDAAAGVGLLLVQLAGGLACWGALNVWTVIRREVVTAGFAVFGVYVVALGFAMYLGWVGSWALTASLWLLGGTVFLAALDVLRRGHAEGILASREIVGILLAWLAFAALQLSVFPRVGVLNPGDIPLSIIIALLLTLPPLAGAALAPWSFGRIRHR